jgi:DNA primase
MDPDDFITSYGPEAYEKLFGEYTEDSYQFRYRYYRMGKNLSNANDLKAYIQAIRGMVSGVDPSIRAFYYNRLATEFQIPLDELGVKQVPKKTEPIKIPNKERPKTTNKYEMAERYLIMAMLKSRDWSHLIMSKLRSNDFAEPIAASIRIAIEHLYEDHEQLTVEELLASLNNDQREMMEQSILKHPIWKKNYVFSEEELLEYIATVYEASDRRRLDELNQRLQEQYDPVLAKERNALKIRLDHITKED